MANVKCPQCGLINWPDAEACKRCGASLLPFSQSKPGVLTWYRAYCVLMVLLYLFCVLAGIVFMIAAPADSDVSATEARLVGAFMFFLGIPCTVYVPNRSFHATKTLGLDLRVGVDLYWPNQPLLSAGNDTAADSLD